MQYLLICFFSDKPTTLLMCAHHCHCYKLESFLLHLSLWWNTDQDHFSPLPLGLDTQSSSVTNFKPWSSWQQRHCSKRKNNGWHDFPESFCGSFSETGSVAGSLGRKGWRSSFLWRGQHPSRSCGRWPTICTSWPWRSWPPLMSLPSTAATRPLSFSCPGLFSRIGSWAFGCVWEHSMITIHWSPEEYWWCFWICTCRL